MPLTAGTRLGPYEIQAALGAGGMGEVYRARDSKLNRDVAIKVLPEMFGSDPDRLARFEREAQALAALNHPNIAHIYGLDRLETPSQPASAFIVMELVDGEELAGRIARGPIPLDEALPIASQIAEALEAAHEQGIIHRDLKPANIKIRHDGTVKVLDFGLAKAMDTTSGPTVSASISPTLSVHATQAGIILGTAAYMSPEQARGRPVDKRADIWAFGVVLYEMVTGRKPFGGDDVGEVLAGVIKEQPPWDDVPPRVRRLLQRCLEKDSKKRLRDISGVALLLEEPAATAPRHLHSSRLAWIATVAVAVLAALAVWAPWRRPQVESRPLVRLDVDLGSDVALASPQGVDVVISRDASRLVWVSRNRLFTRRLDQPKAIELPGTSGAYAPFFSPDGRWVAFFSGGKLKKISVEGGAAIALCDAPQGRGGTWTEDGRIIIAVNGVLLAASENGGTPSPLAEPVTGDGQHRWPQILPGGKAVLFINRATVSSDDANIEVMTLSNRRRKTVQRGGTFARFVSLENGDGYLLYVSRGTLFALPFDAQTLEVGGAPSPVVEDVAYSNLNGSAQFDVSHTGTLVYRPGVAVAVVSLQWLDASGKTESLPTKPGGYGQPRLSPDGGRVALSVLGGAGQDMWVYEWRRDAMIRLTFGAGTYGFPVWTGDGRYLIFTGGFGGGGMYWTRADGGSRPQLLTQSKNGQFPWSVSPDGKRLAFAEFSGNSASGDLWTVPLAIDANGLKAGTPEIFLQTAANELYPAFSPDGRWIAYRTFESGNSEIEVRAFPDTGGKWVISADGGVVPIWSPIGHELFYRTDDQRIMAVNYTAKGDAFIADKPRIWSEKRLAELGQGRNLDISPDGKRFITMMLSEAPGEKSAQSRVVFLENFYDELRRRFSTAK
jgi:Tol biopolymer transport system component